MTALPLRVMIAKVIKMDEILEQALLYDFYGELLNEHQKSVYEQFVLEDLSLSEIAVSEGISRQGVHDMIKRCNKTLTGYEEKLHLVAKFLSVKNKVHQINDILDKEAMKDNRDAKDLINNIKKISTEILEEL